MRQNRVGQRPGDYLAILVTRDSSNVGIKSHGNLRHATIKCCRRAHGAFDPGKPIVERLPLLGTVINRLTKGGTDIGIRQRGKSLDEALV